MAVNNVKENLFKDDDDKIEEMTYESDTEKYRTNEDEDPNDDLENAFEDKTVASSALDELDLLSQAPTEVLAAEYKKLLDQYD